LRWHLALPGPHLRCIGLEEESDVPAKTRQTQKARMDDKLDQALEDSFPASDPVSFIEPGPANGGDRRLPAVKAVGRDKAARKAAGKATRS
jgi:hypothetical protein